MALVKLLLPDLLNWISSGHRFTEESFVRPQGKDLGEIKDSAQTVWGSSSLGARSKMHGLDLLLLKMLVVPGI